MGDGGGLWLNITAVGRKTWVFRYTPKGGAVTEMGLGSYPAISLLDARELAVEHRTHVAKGLNPKTERDRANVQHRSFSDCTKLFLADFENGWKNEKHRQQWRNSLRDYAKPIAKRPVTEIELDDVLKCLRPIWNEKPETASRVRGRIERVLSYAIAQGWRQGANPAIWRGNLDAILPKPKKLQRGHHAAMSWHEVPGFVERLHGHEALAARALEFLILTAGRSGEVLDAKWSEIDLERAIWAIPAERMKAKKEHRVPLTNAAMAILTALNDTKRNDLVFPGNAANKPLSGMAMTMLIRRMKVENITVHGFRSSFRDWAGDQTSFPREVAEGCLAHTIGNAVEQAYRRGDALEKRRQLLEAWANYCTGSQAGNVVALRG